MLTVKERALAIPKIPFKRLNQFRQCSVPFIQLLKGEILPVGVGSCDMRINPAMQFRDCPGIVSLSTAWV